MFATIKSQLILFGALAATFIALLGGTSLFAVRQLQSALDDTTRDALAIRNHLQGDMMHDALRGDVLAGAFAAKTDDAKALTEAAKAAPRNTTRNSQSVLAANLKPSCHPPSTLTCARCNRWCKTTARKRNSR